MLFRSSKTDFSHAILKIVCAAQDLYLNTHEINGQVASIDFGKAYCIFLGGNNQLGLSFLAPIDGIDNFLLRKPMMISEALGINQFGALLNQALLKTFGLSDAA